MNFIWAGNRRSGSLEHIVLVLLLALVSGLFIQNNVLWRWDNLIYDAQLSFWSRTAPDDIIIIAIDDESLNTLGRWPWPRSTHARLINQLERESPRAIGLDIIFSEPDGNDALSDVLLARAMRASGKVVLPVFMSQESRNSYPIEALPLVEFTSNAAALGHVHVDIDDDGIARKVYLREGIGEPHWLHYSLAVLSITNDAVELEKNQDSTVHTKQYSAMHWSREYPFLIPYAGPPGHFQQIGYSQVVAGHYPDNLFRDKIILIGATAEGMGDALPTPLSGNGGSMPGVEIIANTIDAIRHGLQIIEIEKSWQLVITVILVALPVILYPYLKTSITLPALFSIFSGTIIATGLLLWIFGLWLPISTALLFQIIGYPLWSWRRLALAMRHINTELDQLTARQQALSIRRSRNIADEIQFIGLFVAIKGWVIEDENGISILKEGTIPRFNLNTLKPEGWSIDGYRYWAHIRYRNTACRLGLNIGMDSIITDEEMRLLNSLINTPLDTETAHNTYVEDVLQSKIMQVHTAGRKYEELRRIIDDSLSGMADGILICSSRGQVMLSNRRAGWYLHGNDNADINGESLHNVVAHIRQKDGGSWKPLLQRVLFKQERVLTHAQHEAGRDLMVEISPLRTIDDIFDGFVVNFSDISMLTASERKRNEVLNFLSHDLRSPLSSMIALIELAKNKVSIEEMRAMLDSMEKNTHKTLHLAEQFLQLSRANTNEKMNFYDTDFNSVALNAIDQIWALSNKLQVTINHEFSEDELWTHAEPDLLERAIVNLLSNAIKHSEAGATVKVSVSETNNIISCCVKDQGTGISMEELPHLFEMFRLSHNDGVERKQGVGLGLAFVDAVAKRHAGQVDVESRLGEGSSFCLKIPKLDLASPTEHSEH